MLQASEKTAKQKFQEKLLDSYFENLSSEMKKEVLGRNGEITKMVYERNLFVGFLNAGQKSYNGEAVSEKNVIFLEDEITRQIKGTVEEIEEEKRKNKNSQN